jgi:hypothetical protein
MESASLEGVRRSDNPYRSDKPRKGGRRSSFRRARARLARR